MLTMIVGFRQTGEHVASGPGVSRRNVKRLALSADVGPNATLMADSQPAGSAWRGPQSTAEEEVEAGVAATGVDDGVGATVVHAATTETIIIAATTRLRMGMTESRFMGSGYIRPNRSGCRNVTSLRRHESPRCEASQGPAQRPAPAPTLRRRRLLPKGLSDP
jgi:hypothetical protein